MSIHVWPWQETRLRHFAPTEFDHPELMSPHFLELLDELRERCGFAIRVHDDARTEAEHRRLYRPEIQAGRPIPDSAHLRGRAVDITPEVPTEDREIILINVLTSMYRAGEWPHLGLIIETRHVHIDCDPSLAAAGKRPYLGVGVSR